MQQNLLLHIWLPQLTSWAWCHSLAHPCCRPWRWRPWRPPRWPPPPPFGGRGPGGAVGPASGRTGRGSGPEPSPESAAKRKCEHFPPFCINLHFSVKFCALNRHLLWSFIFFPSSIFLLTHFEHLSVWIPISLATNLNPVLSFNKMSSRQQKFSLPPSTSTESE